MTINYTSLLTNDLYKQRRFDAISLMEEVGGKVTLPVYLDGKGYATIGVGFKVDSNWDEILETFGFNISNQASIVEKNYIAQIKAAVGTNRIFTSKTALTTRLNRIMRNLTWSLAC